MKWKAIAIVSMAVNLGFASFDFVWRPYRDTRVREIAGKFNGNAWAFFTEMQKQFYMGGYLGGYWTGHGDGCRTAETISEPSWTSKTTQDCYNSALKYSKGFDYYVERINQYYGRYPEDKRIGVPTLLEQFSDQKNRSLEEIHRRHTSREGL